MKHGYRRSLMIILCLVVFFMPKNQSYAEDLESSAHLSFTNDAPLSVVPDIPADSSNADSSNADSSDETISLDSNNSQLQEKNVRQSLLPQTSESVNLLISLLGVMIVTLVIYLNKNKQKKEGR